MTRETRLRAAVGSCRRSMRDRNGPCEKLTQDNNSPYSDMNFQSQPNSFERQNWNDVDDKCAHFLYCSSAQNGDYHCRLQQGEGGHISPSSNDHRPDRRRNGHGFYESSRNVADSEQQVIEPRQRKLNRYQQENGLRKHQRSMCKSPQMIKQQMDTSLMERQISPNETREMMIKRQSRGCQQKGFQQKRQVSVDDLPQAPTKRQRGECQQQSAQKTCQFSGDDIPQMPIKRQRGECQQLNALQKCKFSKDDIPHKLIKRQRGEYQQLSGLPNRKRRRRGCQYEYDQQKCPFPVANTPEATIKRQRKELCPFQWGEDMEQISHSYDENCEFQQARRGNNDHCYCCGSRSTLPCPSNSGVVDPGGTSCRHQGQTCKREHSKQISWQYGQSADQAPSLLRSFVCSTIFFAFLVCLSLILYFLAVTIPYGRNALVILFLVLTMRVMCPHLKIWCLHRIAANFFTC